MSQSIRCSCDAACGVALTLLDVHSTYAYGDVDPSMATSFIRRGGGLAVLLALLREE